MNNAPSGNPRGVLARLCGAAFLADMALYLTMTGAPYLALAYGAGPLALGFLPVARALPYSLSTVWAGGLTEGRERLRIARGSLVVGALATAGLAFVPSLVPIYVLLGILGLSLAFFWPAVQASLADAALSGQVTGDLGWFNIGWSTGKAAGFLVGGFLLAALGFKAVFLLAALAVLGAAILILWRPPARKHGDGKTPPAGIADHLEKDVPPDRARRFRLAAWIGNSVAFGIGAVLNTHYPEWLTVLGRGEALFGSYLGFIFGAQTLTFAAMIRFTRWRFRVWPLILSQFPLIVVLAILPRLDDPVLILATAPLVGVGLGANYFTSLYYSVHGSADRGRNAGVHEAVLGVGMMVLPVAGGWMAARLDRLDAPYLLAALVGAITLLVQFGILRGPAGWRPEGNRG